jgi:hypothetical protein
MTQIIYRYERIGADGERCHRCGQDLNRLAVTQVKYPGEPLSHTYHARCAPLSDSEVA